jgi:hypothetical protein
MSEDLPDEASIDALIERLKRQGSPRGALVMLNYLRREGVPRPATEVREFLQLSERHFARLENLLLDEGAIVVYLDRVAGRRQKMYALRWLGIPGLASAS